MSQQFFQVLSRVYTFTVGNWPYVDLKELNPYRLASMGYYVSSCFQLQCFVCHHQVSIPQQFEVEYTQTILQLSNHKQNCNYFGCEDLEQFAHQTQITKQQIYLLMDQIAFQIKQTHNILFLKKKFPLLNKNQIEKYLTEDNFTFKSIGQGYRLNWTQQIKISFFLQFFGWGIKRDQANQNQICAECFLCGRKVILNQDIKFIEKEQQEKSLNFTENECFSPVSEHRYFCLWVNPKCSGYKGFSIYIQHLYDKMNESKSLFSKRPPEETKKIRVQLDKYLLSFQQKTTQQFQKVKNIFHECENMKKIILQGQCQKQLFEESEKRMKQFVNQAIGDQIKGQIKKIKLT